MTGNNTNAGKSIALEVSNLSKHFESIKAVDNISFTINKNEIFGLLGPNGAGKTTTISMICGLLPVTGGLVRFGGYEGRDPKSLIGYCPQDNIYYPRLTCHEQLVFIGSMYDISYRELNSRAGELLGMMGLSDKAHRKAATLSGGMKRRLNICLALIHDPEILILDEPEAGLDPQSRILVRDFIKTFGETKTIILTTHNMDEADRLADRVAIIDHGKLLLLDSPQNLKRTVGDGDILEIVPGNSDMQAIGNFTGKISRLSLDVRIAGDSILIRHPGIIDHFVEIKNIADAEHLEISEIKLRENTLEDVFIHLTGRNLRQ